MKKIIAAAFLLLMVPLTYAADRKESQSTIPYVKEAECVNLIASFALVNPIMGQISTAMLGRYPACEVVSIMREAQRLAAAEVAARDTAKDVGSAYGAKAAKAIR